MLNDGTGNCDDELMDECCALEREAIETPALTIKGMATKVILLQEFMEEKENGMTETDLMISAAEDAARLLRLS